MTITFFTALDAALRLFVQLTSNKTNGREKKTNKRVKRNKGAQEKLETMGTNKLQQINQT